MKRTVIAGMLVTMMSGHAMAVMDGNELHEQCEANTAFALGYVVGIVDGYFFSNWKMSGKNLICFPKGSQSKQSMDIICEHIKSHPQDRHLPAGHLSLRSLVEAWPC